MAERTIKINRPAINIIGKIPSSIKSMLGYLGLNRLSSLFLDKYAAELAFQTGWAKQFRENKPKVLEYWRVYRHLEDIKRICSITKKSRVLDVGCGISTVLHFIEGEKHGIDTLADEYKKLYHYPKEMDIRKAFGEDIPFNDDNFDIVFCSNVLDHVTDPKKTIGEICRVLKEGGYFVLTVEIFRERQKRNIAHPNSFTKDDIHSLLKGHFTVLFEKESPWIGLKRYVDGAREGKNKELVMILKDNDLKNQKS